MIVLYYLIFRALIPEWTLNENLLETYNIFHYIFWRPNFCLARVSMNFLGTSTMFS